MIKHISIVVADRKTKGRKSMLIEREDRQKYTVPGKGMTSTSCFNISNIVSLY